MTKARQKGFTLMEMLISMALLALLLVALFAGLRFLRKDDDKVALLLELRESQGLVASVLTRQITNSFPVRATIDNTPHFLFTGKLDRLAFPLLRPPGQGVAGLVLAVFDIVPSEGHARLFYREYAFLPGPKIAVADEPTRSTALADLSAEVQFRYQGKDGQWLPQWNDPANLPDLIALQGGDWPAIVAAPRAEAVAP
jgi:general secretion pathway protein J